MAVLSRSPVAPTEPQEDNRPSNMYRALQACEFPIAVWDFPDGIVRLANQAAADLFSLTIDELVGQPIIDFLTPRHLVETTQQAIGALAVDSVQADRRVVRPDGRSVPVRIWNRSVHVNGLHCAVALIIPIADIALLGRDPASPWRDLTPIAVGIMDHQWRIERLSSDVIYITGIEAAEYAGRSLLSLLHPDDATQLTQKKWTPGTTVTACSRLRIRHRDGSWLGLCLLIGPLGKDRADRSTFALITAPEPSPSWSDSRVSDLERRLRHIGAEVVASGVLETMGSVPARRDAPQMANLSSRQWDILNRLTRGDRVPTIAADLYLSQSTIRNHLSEIFRRFGVHSQSELLDVVRNRAIDGRE
jgi:PAS domain S-box-containing protein